MQLKSLLGHRTSYRHTVLEHIMTLAPNLLGVYARNLAASLFA